MVKTNATKYIQGGCAITCTVRRQAITINKYHICENYATAILLANFLVIFDDEG